MKKNPRNNKNKKLVEILIRQLRLISLLLIGIYFMIFLAVFSYCFYVWGQHYFDNAQEIDSPHTWEPVEEKQSLEETTETTTVTEVSTVVLAAVTEEPTSETTTINPIFINCGAPIDYVPSAYSDLKYRYDISIEDMQAVLSYWYNKNGTVFYGHEYDFIAAAAESDLDPIYILSHAALESSWGKAHLDRHNYFGIAAYDGIEYMSAYSMGTDMRSGLINGSKWIKEYYYDNGFTTLSLMVNQAHYSTSGQYWADTIASIMAESYSVIK